MTIGKVRYILANRAGYKSELSLMGTNVYDDEAYYNKENFPDLELTRPNMDTDLSLVNSHCLVTVNGYIHKTDYVNDRLYVPNGSKSLLLSKQNQLGILSFNHLTDPLTITPLDLVPVTPDDNLSLFDKLTLTFDRDIGNCFLVIAGYPIFEDEEFFYRVNSNSFVLRLDRLNLVEKIYELRRQRRIFEELGVAEPTVNPALVDSTEIRSDSVVLKLLSLFNSFLVEVPCNTLTTKPIYLEQSNIPGNFRTEIEPDDPIVVGFGKFTEYTTKLSNDVKYNVYTSDCHYDNYLFSKLPEGAVGLYNDNRIVGNTHRLTRAFFLRIETT